MRALGRVCHEWLLCRFHNPSYHRYRVIHYSILLEVNSDEVNGA